jgi:hypothetical protein
MVIADATCNTAARHPLAAWMGVAALHAQAAVHGPAFAQRAARATAIEPQVQQYALEANRHRSNHETVGILASLLTDALRPDPNYRLPVPTLLVCGEFDGIGDVARGSRAWARRDALAEYAEIPGAGHTSNLDNPEAFTKILEAFLRRVLPLRSGATAGAGSPDVEASAERLYARFGGRPWQLLPEPPRALSWAGGRRHRWCGSAAQGNRLTGDATRPGPRGNRAGRIVQPTTSAGIP